MDELQSQSQSILAPDPVLTNDTGGGISTETSCLASVEDTMESPDSSSETEDEEETPIVPAKVDNVNVNTDNVNGQISNANNVLNNISSVNGSNNKQSNVTKNNNGSNEKKSNVSNAMESNESYVKKSQRSNNKAVDNDNQLESESQINAGNEVNTMDIEEEGKGSKRTVDDMSLEDESSASWEEVVVSEEVRQAAPVLVAAQFPSGPMTRKKTRSSVISGGLPPSRRKLADKALFSS